MISDFYPVSHSQMGASTLYRAPQLEHPAGSSSWDGGLKWWKLEGRRPRNQPFSSFFGSKKSVRYQEYMCQMWKTSRHSFDLKDLLGIENLLFWSGSLGHWGRTSLRCVWWRPEPTVDISRGRIRSSTQIDFLRCKTSAYLYDIILNYEMILWYDIYIYIWCISIVNMI